MTASLIRERPSTEEGFVGLDWDSPRPRLGGPAVRRRLLEEIADQVIKLAAEERRKTRQRALLAELASASAAAWNGSLTPPRIERIREMLEDLK